jgi:glycosyltransferase involved in cell wall biosynthesis
MTTTDISVIIATRNRQAVLWITLDKACSAISNIKNAEVIVVNDGDGDLNVPERFADKIRFYKNPNRGVSYARNLGALKANGNILFFVDDDMWINAASLEWISEFVIAKQNDSAVYNINWVYPPELNEKLVKTKIGQYILRANYNTMFGRMETGGKQQPENGLYPFNLIMSGSLVISKSIFEKVGKYNENMIFQGEDTDLGRMLNQLAVKIYCVFDVTLFHNHQDRFEMTGLLGRVNDGYASEFKAAKAGFITTNGNKTYKIPRLIIFEFFRLTEWCWFFLHKTLPNWALFRPLNNRIISYLWVLQHYKQWKKSNKQNA